MHGVQWKDYILWLVFFLSNFTHSQKFRNVFKAEVFDAFRNIIRYAGKLHRITRYEIGSLL